VVDAARWVVAVDEEGLRLDVFLSRRLSALAPRLSRREIAELITASQVCVNGHPSKKGDRIHAGDLISAPAMLRVHANAALAIRVVYTDPTLVVLDKAAGIPSVALRYSETGTAANFLAARFPETLTAGPRPLEGGLLHRLDTDTSGLLLAARTPDAYLSLREQFRARTVEKQYLAVVEGCLPNSGQLRSRLAPSGPRGRLMRVVAQGQGQEAHTAYVPLATAERYTLLRVTITTGVRHQIRVHLATLGHPIVGDPLYGTAHRAPRLYLHAEALAVISPTTDQRVRCTSPAPGDFAALVEAGKGTEE
jgi:23S rRNA pseudouridine1911/1915/1917 synthase